MIKPINVSKKLSDGREISIETVDKINAMILENNIQLISIN